MERLVRKHYFLAIIFFILLWVLARQYIPQENPGEKIIFIYLINTLLDPLLIAIIVVFINFFILDIKKRYYLGIGEGVIIYYNIDIQKLLRRRRFQNDNGSFVVHRRITSGDDIIAYSYLEKFLNELDVKHIIDSVQNRQDGMINLVKIGMSNQLFRKACNRLNIEIINSYRTINIRNIKHIGYRSINCKNPCYIFKSYSDDNNIVLHIAGCNESSTLGGAKYLAGNYKEINRNIGIKIRIYHLLSMCLVKVDWIVVVDVDVNNIVMLVGIWCKKGEDIYELYYNQLYRIPNHRMYAHHHRIHIYHHLCRNYRSHRRRRRR